MAASLPILELRADPRTRRIRWTQGAVRRLVDSGLDLEAYELWKGELIHKVKNRPHFAALRRTLAYLRSAFGDEYLQYEMPIQASDAPSDTDETVPEPDIALLHQPSDTFVDAAPLPKDVRLVVEIADSTRSRDLGPKARLYASAGIAEYWVLDLSRRCLHIHRDPVGDGWQVVRLFRPEEEVSPKDSPAPVVTVEELLPPQP